MGNFAGVGSAGSGEEPKWAREVSGGNVGLSTPLPKENNIFPLLIEMQDHLLGTQSLFFLWLLSHSGPGKDFQALV